MSHDAQSAIAARLRQQAQWCHQLGSPLYGTLLEQAARDVEAGGPAWAALQGHETDPPGSVLALRFMSAVHRLVLQGRAPALAQHYPSAGGNAQGNDTWPAFRSTLEEHVPVLRELLERPVQTNEVGRTAALLGGFLLVAQSTALPLRLLEIGASAGLNLRWDHYRYEAEGFAWGDPHSPVRLVDAYLEERPRFDTPVSVLDRAGCDLNPLDPCSAAGQLTLLSYVWADQIGRLATLRGALDVAKRVPVVVVQANAPDWLASQLRHSSPGVATVVFHSIVLQYLSEADRQSVHRILQEAGAYATADAPLAWLFMEPGKVQAEVHLTLWPGGVERLIATAGYHGREVRWLR